jgi:dihydrofolate synthase / folylpolyglutamate synthase
MNYQETVDFLYERLPVYQKYGSSAIKKDLTNIRILCERLGNPHESFPCIHIAGTNGKGTVSHLIAAILQKSGLRVGLYTSPHYVDFRERIKINGDWIGEDWITQFVASQLTTIDEIVPSFFEITVAMAFQYFKDENVDIAVIETGLGGRLDSTNIVYPLLSVITHISLDHMSMLGDNEYMIAHEKAGIIKDNRPIVIGRYQSCCDSVFLSKAKYHNAPLTFASLDWECDGTLLSHNKSHSTIQLGDNYKDESPFFIENVVTAIEAIRIYTSVNTNHGITSDVISRAIEKYRKLTNYIGRWQIVQRQPLVIADSAHNIDAITKVVRQIVNIPANHLRMIIGFVKDKDVESILKILPSHATYYFVEPSIFRALDSHQLHTQAATHRLTGSFFSSVEEGYNAAIAESEPDDFIFIGGSSFVVGDFLAMLQ